MKLTWLVVLTFFTAMFLIPTSRLSARPPKTESDALEKEIRKIDSAVVAAVLASDVSALTKYCAVDLVVNAPNNQIVNGREAVLTKVREGILDYASFECDVEAVEVYGDVAVLMGLETVKPRGKAPLAGQTVRRRFTNVWMKRDGRWQLSARQATIIPLVLTASLSSQPPTKEPTSLEQEIREIDGAENAAVLAKDVPMLEKFWAEDFVVNAPNNQVLKGRMDGIQLVKNGIIDYSSFVRNVEAVAVHGDTAIIMGEETVKPQGKAPFAGQTFHRRFTNIWIKRGGQWQLTARQATIISKE
jgi:ketosteroid isomerase-like protein